MLHLNLFTSRSRWAGLYPLALLLALAAPVLLYRLDVYPPMWLDEGFKTNAARTLAERGFYGHYTTEGYVAFDATISRGPADILPMALSFKALGIGIVQARLPMMLYALVLIGGLYGLGAYLYGQRVGWIVTLAVIAAPSVQGISLIRVSREALGETPALALIVLGLGLWFRSWATPSTRLTLAAGFLLGLGVLSKEQIFLILWPTLIIVVAGRWLAWEQKDWRALLLVALPVSIYGLWNLYGKLVTPVAQQVENARLFPLVLRMLVLNSPWERPLASSAEHVVMVMAAGVLAGGGQVVQAWRKHGRRLLATGWAEAAVTVFVLGTTLWFALFSVGWPRYAYAGLVLSWFLLARTGWSLAEWLWNTGPFRRLSPNVPYGLALVGLIIANGWINLVPVLRFDRPSGLRETADYIRASIPADAVVETWDWELDALSGHWEFHHPAQIYLPEVIDQFSHARPFDLNYDLLKANPDYLIIGSHSEWTDIYDPAAVQANFMTLTRIGDYQILQRPQLRGALMAQTRRLKGRTPE